MSSNSLVWKSFLRIELYLHEGLWLRGKYYCITIPVLERLFIQAGFQKVTTLREKFCQPLIVAEK